MYLLFSYWAFYADTRTLPTAKLGYILLLLDLRYWSADTNTNKPIRVSGVSIKQMIQKPADVSSQNKSIWHKHKEWPTLTINETISRE